MAESFRALSATLNFIVKVFEKESKQFEQTVVEITPIIVNKLKESDIDQDIKLAVNNCTTSLLANLGFTLNVKNFN